MAKPNKDKGKGKLTPAQRKRRNKRAAWAAVYDPTQMISGMPLKRVANALTRIELGPGIAAQKAAIAASRRGQEYDTAALDKMGTRLDEDMSGLATRVAGYRQQAIDRATQSRDRMYQGLADTTKQSTDQLNSLQGQVLGSQVSQLKEAGVDTGQSGTEQAAANLLQGERGAADRQTESWNNLARLIGEQGITTAGAMGDAAQYGAESDRGAIKRNIASRIADRRQMGSEERAAAQAELGTLRGLKGATRLKNLMDLRREQQDYGARKAEIAASRQQWKAENAVDWFNALTRRQEAQDDGSSDGNGGRGPDDTPRKMTKAEWQDWRSVGQEILSSQPGAKITNWSEFLDAVAATEGVSWKPRERALFKQRFQRWYNQNY